MQHLGNFSLMAIVVLAGYALVASVIGARRKNNSLVVSAERALLAAAVFSTTATVSLLRLLLQSDFRFEYVASYSNKDLPFIYKLASLWAGNDGSLLFWSWLILVFTALTILVNRNKNRELMPYVVATLSVVILFFTYMNYWVCNPYGMIAVESASGPVAWAPPDGRGLNPLLQHPIMAIHPPILYIGYVSFVIPFAFCVAALWTRQLGAQWITSTRRWTLVLLVLPGNRAHPRRPMGLRRAGVGWVLGLGSGRERGLDALVDSYRVSALGHDPGTQGDAQDLEREPGNRDLPAVHHGYVPDP